MSQGEMGNMAFRQPEAAPGLFTFLWGKFVEHSGGDPATAMKLDCVHFINFAEQYLSEHRPTLTFVAQANVGVYLGESQRVLIAPPVNDAPTGEMAPTKLPNQGAVMITGNAKKRAGQEDLSAYDQRTFEQAGGKKMSATVETKPEKLDQRDPYNRERR